MRAIHMSPRRGDAACETTLPDGDSGMYFRKFFATGLMQPGAMN